LQVMTLASSCCVAVAARAADTSVLERYQLPNGLRVVLAPDRVTPGVSLMVRYGVGAAHAPRGYRGISHLLEHLTFRGSRHVAPLEAFAILQELGAEANATTSLEETEYFAELPAADLETALWLESERMAFTLSRLDQRALDLERRIVDNEHRQRFGTFSNMMARYWLRALYGDGHPFVDDPEHVVDLGAVTLPAVQWFFQTGYRPDNATLVLVGKLDPPRARALIEKYFGPIVSSDVPRSSLSPSPPRLCGLHRVELGHAGLFGHALRATWSRPAVATAADNASVAVLEHIYEGRLRSALLRASAESAGVDAFTAHFSTHELFTVDVELHENADARAVEATVLREARALSQQALSEGELRSARSHLLAEAVFAREDGVARARELAEGRDPDAEGAALRSLSPAQVLDAARPLGGAALVLHVHSSPGEGRTRVEREESPCP
jgi:zinc protease